MVLHGDNGCFVPDWVNEWVSKWPNEWVIYQLFNCDWLFIDIVTMAALFQIEWVNSNGSQYNLYSGCVDNIWFELNVISSKIVFPTSSLHTHTHTHEALRSKLENWKTPDDGCFVPDWVSEWVSKWLNEWAIYQLYNGDLLFVDMVTMAALFQLNMVNWWLSCNVIITQFLWIVHFWLPLRYSQSLLYKYECIQ
jgi:hypothetical protein